MEVITDIASLRQRLKYEPSIAFVPTMGNLHAGHLSLVRTARQKAQCAVVSVFVNRLQFGPKEDFGRYPRTLAEDCALLENEGVDVVFAPGETELYPVAQEFQVLTPPMADTLEGAFRPGFFQGVSTVVLKLLNIVQPAVVVFGKKDYQQLVLMRQLVREFNLPLEIVAGETERAADGLALSSRNSYLTLEERAEATRLYQVLSHIKQQMESGAGNPRELEADAKQNLQDHGWQVDYVTICDRCTLARAGARDGNLVVLGAARLGKTRLIDNLEISMEGCGDVRKKR
ncbi:MAG TPA: pantoate--beta-alanine ligase [Nitrosospira sp.]|nr:pantoate--beta-alanine ligase [Nitrosospira sp.]